ncbi:MAG: hypothetical protein SFY56_09735 [Bacteroidota bacterium]|nr:hypothetical protein [Bacteroidota bacterium]
MFLKSILLLLFFLMTYTFVWGQKLSNYEKCWAFCHPIAALKVKHISKNCFKIYQQSTITIQLDKNANGGKLDAFRHTFFMAAFAQKIKIRKLKKLGIAHEKYNYKQFLKSEFENGEVPDSLGTIMDLKNNDLGLEIGTKYKKENLVKLSEIVINAIHSGEAVVIKRNKLGDYVDCNGQIIILPKQKKWGNNKCIVKSNEN